MDRKYSYEEAKVILKKGFTSDEVLKGNIAYNTKIGGIIGGIIFAIGGINMLATGSPVLMEVTTPIALISACQAIPDVILYCIGRKRAKEGSLDKFPTDFAISMAEVWAKKYPNYVLEKYNLNQDDDLSDKENEEEENVKHR